MLLLLKALVPKLTSISGSTRADGVAVAPYMAVRHVLDPDLTATDPPALADADSPAGEPPAAIETTPPGQAEPEAEEAFSALLAEVATLSPPPDPEIAAIEDRIDLADAMAEDPHSDRTKRLLQIMAVKELDRIAQDVPAVRTLLVAAALSSALAEENLAERLRAFFASDTGDASAS